jgi:predicted nucleotidyltransferase
MHPLIETHRAAIRALAAKHGVTDVRVFGSMARGDATEASDVDLVVRPLPGTSLLELARPSQSKRPNRPLWPVNHS